jgi:SAM-dependent methyltransferase
MTEIERIRAAYARRRATGRDARYTVFDRANLFRIQALERALVEALRAEGLTRPAALRVLDVGCGAGWWLRTLLRWGARPEHLAGIDLQPEPLAAAREVHPQAAVLRAAADALPFRDGTFDIVSQFTVFSSILDAGMRRRAARELLRVLRPGGVGLWYDFTVNPRNPDTRGIGRRDLAALFPGCPLRVRRVTLAPPLARLVVPHARPVAELLEALPFLRTHLLATIRRPAGTATGEQRAQP